MSTRFGTFFGTFYFDVFGTHIKRLVPLVFKISSFIKKSFRFGTNILRFGTNCVFFGTNCVRFGTKTKNYFSSHLGVIFISSIKFTTSTSASHNPHRITTNLIINSSRKVWECVLCKDVGDNKANKGNLLLISKVILRKKTGKDGKNDSDDMNVDFRF